MTDIDVYFDYASPFAYIGSEALPRFAESVGASLRWHPLQLEFLSNYADGLPYSEVKRSYVLVDAVRAAEYHGVPIEVPEPFPVRSELANRLALFVPPEFDFEPLHQALLRAAWAERHDLGNPEVLARCIDDAGGDHGWLAAAQRAEAGDRLRAASAAADGLGVFGVPTMVLDGELFWGLDSLPTLRWRVEKAAGQLNQLGSVSPFFIVEDVPRAVAFYVDKLGFEVRFSGPDPLFFAIVGRGPVQIYLKHVGLEVAPLPNRERHEWARWDAFVYAPDPDDLAREVENRGAQFHTTIADTDDGLRGFEVRDVDGYVLFFGRPR